MSAVVYQGSIRNGTVVVEGQLPLPDGTAVEIIPLRRQTPEAPVVGNDILLQIARMAQPTGIPDLSVNIDHYLYGHPKVTDEQ